MDRWMSFCNSKLNMIVKILILFILIAGSESLKVQCPCVAPKYSSSECKPIDSWNTNDNEIVVMTRHNSTQFETWNWDSITTVIEMKTEDNHTHNDDLMCHTHSKGKKYGITVDIPGSVYDGTDPKLDSFVNDTTNLIKSRYADVLNLDLLPLLGKCDNAGKHVTGITNVVTKVIKGLKTNKSNLRILCVMPWKPPCYDNDCTLGPAISQLCDAIILSPDSYATYCEEACVARATTPYAKMLLGILEYEAVGFKQTQLLLGIPWHGYEYTCVDSKQLEGTSDHIVCHLRDDVNQTCDLDAHRVRVNLGYYLKQHPERIYTESEYSRPDQAPWNNTTHKVDNKTEVHVTWFENIGSLEAKYKMVKEYALKGAAIYTADDLDVSKVGEGGNHFDRLMWGWTLHAILSTGDTSNKSEETNYAGIVAGVGVGMFVFGTILGVLFACVIFRRNTKLKAPFHHDEYADEFHDDDNAL